MSLGYKTGQIGGRLVGGGLGFVLGGPAGAAIGASTLGPMLGDMVTGDETKDKTIYNWNDPRANMAYEDKSMNRLSSSTMQYNPNQQFDATMGTIDSLVGAASQFLPGPKAKTPTGGNVDGTGLGLSARNMAADTLGQSRSNLNVQQFGQDVTPKAFGQPIQPGGLVNAGGLGLGSNQASKDIWNNTPQLPFSDMEAGFARANPVFSNKYDGVSEITMTEEEMKRQMGLSQSPMFKWSGNQQVGLSGFALNAY